MSADKQSKSACEDHVGWTSPAVASVGKKGERGRRDDQLDKPNGIAIGREGQIYIADHAFKYSMLISHIREHAPFPTTIKVQLFVPKRLPSIVLVMPM